MRFFAYGWKLPAYNGPWTFLLTIDNLNYFSFLLTVGAFLLTMGKCV